MPASAPSPRRNKALEPKPTHLAAAAGLLVLGILAGPAAAQGRTDTIAVTGQSAMGAGGGTFSSSFSTPLLNDAGQTAFRANVIGGTSTEGIFRSSSGGALTAIALLGQAAPGETGGRFTGFDEGLVLNNSGQTAFWARSTSAAGIYRGSSGTALTTIVRRGQNAPGAGPGTFAGFEVTTSLNDEGEVGVTGAITGGTSESGLFKSNGSGLAVIALQGWSAPGVGAGTFSGFLGEPLLNNAGQTVFVASITGGTSGRGIFSRTNAGMFTAIALEGQSAPGAGTGTFSSFISLQVNDAGQTVFLGGINSGGSLSRGIYRSSGGGALTTIALDGQSAPGAGAGRFRGLLGPVQNDAGQAAFRASIDGGSSTQGLYRSSSGSALTAIALQGQTATGAGTGTFSGFDSTYVLNDAGVMAFSAGVTGGTSTQGLYLGDGRETVVAQLQGAALAGKTVSSLETSASSLNRHGQLAYRATFTDGTQGNFLFTPALRWRETFSSSWDNADRWTLGITPAAVHDVSIDPSVALTVTGPAGPVEVRSLTVGSGTGFATLSLGGGTLGSASAVQVASRGILTGSGTITAQVINVGEVRADSLILSNGLVNSGTVRGAATGNQRIDTNLNNSSGGLVRVDSGETLKLVGSAHSNSGSIEVRGGEVQVTGLVTNNAAGRIVLNGGIARFNGGVANSGQVQVSFGGGDVFGAITTQSGGKLILSGNSNTTFYDAVDVARGGELRVSAGSTAVFFGAMFQRSGALFSGTGTKFYEGGLNIGGSPGLGADAGDVSFGAGNVYVAEIGGLAAGSEHDQYQVAGHLHFGGTLQIVSWAGYTGQVGDSVDLFDWGSHSGSFGVIDSSSLQLAPGAVLDVSSLYVDGRVTVAAVPEPGSWALFGAGAWVLAGLRRRQLRAGLMGTPHRTTP